MNLSKQMVGRVSPGAVEVPGPDYFNLPEKVLQFGTGVLLRALPDYFIDKANKHGVFNGRVVMVKSTSGGGADEFARQDGLYTICIRGIEAGKQKEENCINASVSRVINANQEWDAVLQCASNPGMQIVISNTTEVGITLVKDNVHASPPESFPGKLLAFLYRRYQVFHADPEKGMVIIPTELIPDNGGRLLSILLELAKQNGLGPGFPDWLRQANYFCNSLVDRIVPGRLPAITQKEMEEKLGYSDALMIMAEWYNLWAIESGEEKVKQVLSFSKVNPGVIIAPDISIFRELKLRLLNGSHTFSCGLAYLAGFKTVKQAMQDPGFAAYITKLMMQEIAPAIITEKLTMEMAKDFAAKVLDRYRNPYLEHQWLSIAMQYASKMRMRNVPLILSHYHRSQAVPAGMALGFAAHILFMKPERAEAVPDDRAAYYTDAWKQWMPDELVKKILGDENLWGADLTALNGFLPAVTADLHLLMEQGAAAAIKKYNSL